MSARDLCDRLEPCVKCGATGAGLRWISQASFSNASAGLMFAECHRCGYEWRIKALDEEDAE